MEKLTIATLHALDALFKGKRARICIIIDNDYQLPLAIANAGHRLVVVGDRFKPLFRFANMNQQYNPAVTVEAQYRALPLQPRSFDAVIVARSMPKGTDLAKELEHLKQYVKPEGLLFWFHPLFEGILGKTRRLFSPKHLRIERHVLCRSAMKQGFLQIGQVLVKGPGTRRSVLTKAMVP